MQPDHIRDPNHGASHRLYGSLHLRNYTRSGEAFMGLWASIATIGSDMFVTHDEDPPSASVTQLPVSLLIFDCVRFAPMWT